MAEDNDDLLDPAEIEALLNEAGANDVPPPTPKAASEQPSPPAAETSIAESGADSGDAMSQDDLDRLIAEATAGTSARNAPSQKPPSARKPKSPVDDDDLLDPGEIEQLLNSHNPAESARRPTTSTNPAAASMSSSKTDELLRQAEAGLAAAISSDGGGFVKPGLHGNPQPYTFQEFSKPAITASEVALNTLHDVELDIRIELGRTELLIEEVLQLRDGSVVPLDKLAGDPVDVIVNERLIARGEVLVLNDNFCVRITEILPPHF